LVKKNADTAYNEAMRPRLAVALLLVTIASNTRAARLGPARLVGPVGPPSESQLGAILPFPPPWGHGQVAFTVDRGRYDGPQTLLDIAATPIDSLGVVQYAFKQEVGGVAKSIPLVAQTAEGYMGAWQTFFGNGVMVAPMAPWLGPRGDKDTAVIPFSTPVDLVCSGARCLLTTRNESTSGVTVTLLRSSDGHAQPPPDQALANHSSITGVRGGFAFTNGRGVTWVDTEGHITGETVLPFDPTITGTVITAHPAGALVITFSPSFVRAWIVSPSSGLVKTAVYAPLTGGEWEDARISAHRGERQWIELRHRGLHEICGTPPAGRAWSQRLLHQCRPRRRASVVSARHGIAPAVDGSLHFTRRR
jgi:hypothetical protein